MIITIDSTIRSSTGTSVLQGPIIAPMGSKVTLKPDSELRINQANSFENLEIDNAGGNVVLQSGNLGKGKS